MSFCESIKIGENMPNLFWIVADHLRRCSQGHYIIPYILFALFVGQGQEYFGLHLSLGCHTKESFFPCSLYPKLVRRVSMLLVDYESKYPPVLHHCW